MRIQLVAHCQLPLIPPTKKTKTQNNGPDLVITGHHTYAVTEENHDEQEQHVWDY